MELNLTKIEENSWILAEIEQKITSLQDNTTKKFSLIEKTADCIHEQFSSLQSILPAKDFKNYSDSFRFFELNEKELNKIDKSFLHLLQKLEYSNILRDFIFGICGFVEKKLKDKMEKQIISGFETLEEKINKVKNTISIMEIKREMERENIGKKIISEKMEIQKETSYDVDNDDKENKKHLGNLKLERQGKRNFLENFMMSFYFFSKAKVRNRKMDEYKMFFRKFLDEIKIILKNIDENDGLKFEEFKFLKSEVETKREMVKDLDRFLAHMVLHFHYLFKF